MFKPKGYDYDQETHSLVKQDSPQRQAFKSLSDEGRELRDRFAMAAIQGLLASECCPDESVIGSSYISYESEAVAARAYHIADAMMKARIPD